MSNDDTYNGWANRETWAFWLHVSNDRGMYEMTREYAKDVLGLDTASDREVGERVVDMWRDYLDTYADEYGVPLGDSLLCFDRKVGSWWRLDYAEIGAAVREDLDD